MLQIGAHSTQSPNVHPSVEEPGPPRVIACGGGIVRRKANRLRLAHAGLVLWLDVPVETARQRCAKSSNQRPLVDVLYRQPRRLATRVRHYRTLGRRVDAGRPFREVLGKVLELLASAGIRHLRPASPDG